MKYRDIITIDSDKGTFSKRFPEDQYPAMLDKFQKLNEIDISSERVLVPQLIGSDDDNYTLIFQFIEGLNPIRNYLLDEKMSNIIERVAKGIAVFHKTLKLNLEFQTKLPAPFDNYKDDCAYLHLDFNLVNVQYNEDEDKIYFVDWEMSPLLGGKSNYGTIYYDLAYFVYQIYNSPPYIFTSSSKKDVLVDRFLKAYQEVYGSLDFNEFASFCESYYSVFKSFETYSFWRHRVKYFNYKDFEIFLARIYSNK